MGEHSCIWYIRNLRFFPQLDEETMMDLAARSRMFTAKRGDRLTVANTAAGQALLVKEGHLRAMRKAPDGREMGLDVLGPGDVIGVTPVLTEDGDADVAEAMEDVLLCRVPTSLLREVLERSPGLALHFSKQMGLRRRRIETRLVGIAFCTVKVRLARLLLELGEKFGRDEAGGRLIDLKLTHGEIADMIGSNREAANRAVLSLLDDGILRLEGKKIRIADPKGLAKEAELAFVWQSVSSDTA